MAIINPSRFSQRYFTTVVLLTGLSLVGLAADATAGCLKEWEECGDCAERKARQAVRDLEVDDLIDAWVDAIDCDIDLYHCILLGQHHSYTC